MVGFIIYRVVWVYNSLFFFPRSLLSKRFRGLGFGGLG